MTIDELIIAIRVNAEGVKQGIETAKTGLRSLTAEQAKWKEELKLRLDAAGVTDLKKKLQEIEAEKRNLEKEIKFGADAKALDKIQDRLRHIDIEKIKLERTMSLNIDDSEAEQLIKEFDALTAEKKELEKELKFGVHVTGLKESETEIGKLDKQIRSLENEITVRIETSGAREATDELKRLEQQSDKVAEAMPKVGVAAAAAFAGIVVAVKKGVDAYTESVEAQTKLSHMMQLNLGASSEQVQSIVELTQAQEKLGVVSATAQQAGAQELATYMKKTDSLKKLIPVLNDVVAQQYGYKASGEQSRTVATMLGKVFEGEVGSLKRYGYSFSEAQEEILKFGDEASKVATLIEVIGSTVGGTNEALAQTDSGRIKQLALEAERASEAFGGALTSSIAGFADIFKSAVGFTADFIEQNPSLVSGLAAGAFGFAGLTAAVIIYKKVVDAAKTANILFTASNPMGWVLLAIGAVAGLATGIVTAINNQKKAQEELNQKVKEYNDLLKGEITASTIDATKAKHDEMDEKIALYDELVIKQKELKENVRSLLEVWDYSAAGELTQELNTVEESLISLATEFKAHGKSVDELRADNQAMADSIAKYNNSLEETIPILDQITTKMDEYLKQTNKLESAQEKLAKSEQLSREELQQLIQTYPQVAAHIANNVNWQETLADVLAEVGEQEKRTMEASINSAVSRTKTTLAETEARIGAIESEIKALALLKKAHGDMGLGFGLEEWNAESESALNDKLAEARKQQADLNNLLAEIELLKIGGSKSVSGKTEDTAQKAYDAARKLYEQEKALTELSTEQQIAALEKLKDAHANYADGVMTIERELYGLRKDLADESYKAALDSVKTEAEQSGGMFDYQAYINGLQDFKAKVIEIYAGFPETLKAALNEIEKLEVDAARSRADKIVMIESDKVDKAISSYDYLIRKQQTMNGLVTDDGSVFSFGSSEQAEIIRSQLAEIDSAIAGFMENEQNLTAAEKQELDKRLAQRENYLQQIELLMINVAKERQQAAEKALSDELKSFEVAQKQKETIEKASNKVIIDDIKKRYAEEISLAESAANAEIAIYEDRIKAIDALLKEESRADTDTEQLDKLRRLQEQLAYEVDESNIYELQKELANEQAEFEKRKRKESLEDEKTALRDQINAVKNSVSERKSQLAEIRDAETAAQEESYNAYVQFLADEVTALEESNKQKLAILKQQALAESRIKSGIAYTGEDSEGSQTVEEFTGELNRKYQAETEHNKDLTEDLKSNLNSRFEDDKKYFTKLESRIEENAKFTVNSVQTTIGNIINILYQQLEAFASAGRAAGNAWGNAYNQAVDEMLSRQAASQAASQSSSAQAMSQSLTVQNTFNVPVVTPSAATSALVQSGNDLLRVLG